MDASDKIRRDQAKAIWVNYKTVTLAAQPTCNYSTCGAALQSTCVVKYTTYESRYQIAQGRRDCATCSTGASTFCL